MERLSCDILWLIGDVCLSNGCQSLDKCDMCSIQCIEVVVDWFGAIMWGTIKMSNSTIGGAGESSCSTESVDEEGCMPAHSSDFYK